MFCSFMSYILLAFASNYDLAKYMVDKAKPSEFVGLLG